ncbi:MAG: alpha/beta hydrolase [Comamonadaceae bacterium]|nr:alpha/beta hydrolase [Comamonadaceae bacterium]
MPPPGGTAPSPSSSSTADPGRRCAIEDRQFFERFAREGYDVYLYEQAGTGRSDPLRDLRDYTVQRNVDDLEAIRRTIGAERLILIGQSWGAVLAAHYAADHPQRVAKLIFPSPGPMRHADQRTIDASRTAAARADMTPPLRVMAARLLRGGQPGAGRELRAAAGNERLHGQRRAAAHAPVLLRRRRRERAAGGQGRLQFLRQPPDAAGPGTPFRPSPGVAPGRDAGPGDEGRMRLRALGGGPRLRSPASPTPGWSIWSAPGTCYGAGSRT